MENQNTISDNDITFIRLLRGTEPKADTGYRVEIPIVQRDYAQGRKDVDIKGKLNNILQDIKEAVLDTTKRLSLNFVYGKIEGEKFIPMDGQQRLTLLFLLHVYAFAADEGAKNFLAKFSYKTRDTSTQFVAKLGSVLELLICYTVVIERSRSNGSSIFTLSFLW